MWHWGTGKTHAEKGVREKKKSAEGTPIENIFATDWVQVV
jgi:hypothetical protein